MNTMKVMKWNAQTGRPVVTAKAMRRQKTIPYDLSMSMEDNLNRAAMELANILRIGVGAVLSDTGSRRVYEVI